MTAPVRRHGVTHVSPFFPPHLGGVENVTESMTRMLASQYQVEVLTTRNGTNGTPRLEFRNGVRIRRCSGVVLAHTALSVEMVLRLLAIDPDIILHVHVENAFVPEAVGLTSAVRRRRYIAHFHLDVEPSGRLGGVLGLYKRYVLGPCLRRASAVVALTESQREFISRRYRVPRERIVVIPNGVDDLYFARAGDLASDPVGGRTPRLLFVGRIDPQKNVARLIDAMSHIVHPTDLVIVGDGEQRNQIANRIADLELTNVRLVGPARGADLRAWYRWADVFVLPSDKEGMPLVLLEAMAQGLAIVATDVDGTRDVAAGVGMLADASAPALAAAIEHVVSTPGLIESLSARSLERAESYRWKHSIEAMSRLYDEVAGQE